MNNPFIGFTIIILRMNRNLHLSLVDNMVYDWEVMLPHGLLLEYFAPKLGLKNLDRCV
jgi:hypothetical protein